MPVSMVGGAHPSGHGQFLCFSNAYLSHSPPPLSTLPGAYDMLLVKSVGDDNFM